MEPQTIKNYIGGHWVASQSTNTLNVHNPATNEVMARVPLSTADEVQAVIHAARSAFHEWRETPPYARAKCSTSRN